jgi:hypothetical protein
VATESNRPWEIEPVTNPDRVLSAERIESSCDRAILDLGQRWFSPAREGIASRIPRARIVDPGPDGPAQAGR